MGSGAMICAQAFAFRRWHSAHSFSNSRITSRPEIIQFRADNVVNVWLVPEAWFPFSLYSFKISFVIQLFLGRMTGCRTSNERNLACFRRPPESINPSSSSFCCNPRCLLFAGNGRPRDTDVLSSRNSVHWANLISFICALFSSPTSNSLDVLPTSEFLQFAMKG